MLNISIKNRRKCRLMFRKSKAIDYFNNMTNLFTTKINILRLMVILTIVCLGVNILEELLLSGSFFLQTTENQIINNAVLFFSTFF